MCGIVGVAGVINGKAETVFKQLLEVDSLRGRHSTGVIKVESNGTVTTMKKAVDGMDFVKLFGDRITQGLNKVLIGHNRYATKGAINDVNAHPFSHGDIHAVHNGTLSNQHVLKESNKFQVDSDNMIYNISKEGVEETANKIRGAWTVVGWDEGKKEMFFFRNEQRPLHMAFSDDGKTIYFASEGTMLEWVLDRNGVEYKEILSLNIEQLMKLKPLEVESADAKTLASVFTLNKLDYAKAVVYSGGNYNGRHGKKLSDWGLKGNEAYPVSIIAKETTGTPNNNGFKFTLMLMCPPHCEWEVNVYSPAAKTMMDNAWNNDEILQTRHLSQDYNSGEPKCYSVDLCKLTDKVAEKIQAPSDEEDDDYDDDIPFDEALDMLQLEYKDTVTDAIIFDAKTGHCIKPVEGKWTDSNGKTYTDRTFALSNAKENGCCMCGDLFEKEHDVIHWVGEVLGEACCSHCVSEFKNIYGAE